MVGFGVKLSVHQSCGNMTTYAWNIHLWCWSPNVHSKMNTKTPKSPCLKLGIFCSNVGVMSYVNIPPLRPWLSSFTIFRNFRLNVLPDTFLYIFTSCYTLLISGSTFLSLVHGFSSRILLHTRWTSYILANNNWFWAFRIPQR